jgi:hypothetical protein
MYRKTYLDNIFLGNIFTGNIPMYRKHLFFSGPRAEDNGFKSSNLRFGLLNVAIYIY